LTPRLDDDACVWYVRLCSTVRVHDHTLPSSDVNALGSAVSVSAHRPSLPDHSREELPGLLRPLGLGTGASAARAMYIQEADMKHARVAMLAAARTTSSRRGARAPPTSRSSHRDLLFRRLSQLNPGLYTPRSFTVYTMMVRLHSASYVDELRPPRRRRQGDAAQQEKSRQENGQVVAD
jgi:hypothetical protein